MNKVRIDSELREMARKLGKQRDDEAKKHRRIRVDNEGKDSTFLMHWQGAYCDMLVPWMYDFIELSQPLFIEGVFTQGNDFIIKGKEYEGKCNRIPFLDTVDTYFINVQKHATALKRGARGIICTAINGEPDVALEFCVFGWMPIDIPMRYKPETKYVSPQYTIPFQEIRDILELKEVAG